MCPTEDVRVSLSTVKSPEDRNEVTGNLQKCCTLLSLFKDQNELLAFKDDDTEILNTNLAIVIPTSHMGTTVWMWRRLLGGEGTGNGVYDHSHLY